MVRNEGMHGARPEWYIEDVTYKAVWDSADWPTSWCCAWRRYRLTPAQVQLIYRSA